MDKIIRISDITIYMRILYVLNIKVQRIYDLKSIFSYTHFNNGRKLMEVQPIPKFHVPMPQNLKRLD
jgi:hypothetical protein